MMGDSTSRNNRVESLFQEPSMFLKSDKYAGTYNPEKSSYPTLGSSLSRRPMKAPELIEMARELDPDAYLEASKTKQNLIDKKLEENKLG